MGNKGKKDKDKSQKQTRWRDGNRRPFLAKSKRRERDSLSIFRKTTKQEQSITSLMD